jgi:acyl-coenzyme A synthetase/AMP-(fatty) acid ligase
VTFQNRTLTFRELLEKIDALAATLRESSLAPGGRIALLLPNGFEFVFAFLAPAALGAVIVPLDPTMKPADLIHILEDSGCSHVLTDPACLDEETRSVLENVGGSRPGSLRVLSVSELTLEKAKDVSFEAVSPDAPAAFFYTSGTTGVPKAVVHSHRTLLYALTQTDLAKRGKF